MDVLLDEVGSDVRLVCIGEATHGTSEFYMKRIALTKRLILEKEFDWVAVEGDWPDCYKINCFVKGEENGLAKEVLSQFHRWPTWMWANEEVAEFVEWLKHFNSGSTRQPIGFYGLDVYSLGQSLQVTFDYLKKHDPQSSCEKPVLELLSQMLANAHMYGDKDEALNVVQNCLVAANAERYYRQQLFGGPESWNIRDRHMIETVSQLLHVHPKSKGIIWAHNTHVGDARATDMAKCGMVNIGQLLREVYSKTSVYLIGFSTYKGQVMASRKWGDETKEMKVPPAAFGSWDSELRTGGTDRIHIMKGNPGFDTVKMQRAIGVVYKPEKEPSSNYVPTNLAQRLASHSCEVRTRCGLTLIYIH
ncbi:erythromycin esterase family protein [Pelomyxa schiedti]|nr:erythromycin esterase family protein [Pelomyxa schiedti]